ncbi:MAG: tRNA uridine-5-carboxymethylaminomethyl(34) synthesis enzyme MnmG, partial [Erysipelotrichaceae bacterium]|nr:tRNA uridine-5-carboxymethylaminomethyl(34) synthesis enzyme MnmG [Erysipelotrichaceae bacterium]
VEKLNEYKQLFNETKLTLSDELHEYLLANGYGEMPQQGITVYELLRRPALKTAEICRLQKIEIDPKMAEQLDIEIKFEGYIAKARREADNLVRMEKIQIDESIDYSQMVHLSLEAKQKLQKVRPLTIGQASRISGVNPADIMVLLTYLKQHRSAEGEENGN